MSSKAKLFAQRYSQSALRRANQSVIDRHLRNLRQNFRPRIVSVLRDGSGIWTAFDHDNNPVGFFGDSFAKQIGEMAAGFPKARAALRRGAKLSYRRLTRRSPVR